GAVDGRAFLVAGDQETDRALRRMTLDVACRGRGEGRNSGFHVDRAAAIESAVLDLRRKGIMPPQHRIARGHDVGVPGKAEMRRSVADPRVKIVDFAETQPVAFKSEWRK